MIRAVPASYREFVAGSSAQEQQPFSPQCGAR
jgi:hypothetical protein